MVRAIFVYVMTLLALALLWPALRRFGMTGLPGDWITEFGARLVTVPFSSAAVAALVIGAALWFANR